METEVRTIHHNMERAKEQIALAAQSANRRAADVRLVVVTKAQPEEVVRAVIDAGGEILGENYPQESLSKIAAIGHPAGIAWHMIGHLQSRKAPIVATHFDMLQSLDSLALAVKLDRLLAGVRQGFPVLLEMNVSGEGSKFGWPAWDETQWERLHSEIEQVLALPHLAVRGLMTMPPYYEDPERTRPYFVRLRKLADHLGKHFGRSHFQELSMGTSVDYPVAVQEGATYVRIGTAIVGPRPAKG